MTTPAIYNKLTPILRKVFKDEMLVPRPEMTAKDVRGWDSLKHIRLVIEVERGFGIKFATSEVSKFKNIGDLAAMIEQKQT